MAGYGVLQVSKAVACMTRTVFVFGGKNVDMINTIKDITDKTINESYPDHTDQQMLVAVLPEKLQPKFHVIQLALQYSQYAYENSILPRDQILLIDQQAVFIARAIHTVIAKGKNTPLKAESVKIAKIMESLCMLYYIYHKTGDKIHHTKIQKKITMIHDCVNLSSNSETATEQYR